MIDDCKKYGLTREDFVKYKDYFFKMLEQSGIEKAEEKSVNQKHDKSIKDILVESGYKLEDSNVVINSRFFGSIEVLNSCISPKTFTSPLSAFIIII